MIFDYTPLMLRRSYYNNHMNSDIDRNRHLFQVGIVRNSSFGKSLYRNNTYYHNAVIPNNSQNKAGIGLIRNSSYGKRLYENNSYFDKLFRQYYAQKKPKHEMICTADHC